ncbi:MAG: hypothetical protein HUJ61_07585 [Bacilli bacterium]|nr:hypothetical protein [Bacilli bacterium]
MINKLKDKFNLHCNYRFELTDLIALLDIIAVSDIIFFHLGISIFLFVIACGTSLFISIKYGNKINLIVINFAFSLLNIYYLFN